jgi:hypothetical protein
MGTLLVIVCFYGFRAMRMLAKYEVMAALAMRRKSAWESGISSQLAIGMGKSSQTARAATSKAPSSRSIVGWRLSAWTGFSRKVRKLLQAKFFSAPQVEFF